MAAEFFLRAANQGHAQAQYRVARMLRSGEWYEKDELASARWMHRAAGAGHVEALARAKSARGPLDPR